MNIFVIKAILVLLTVHPTSVIVATAAPVTNPQRVSCQRFAPDSSPTLSNCPIGTIYVSATDETAHYSKVQAAVASLPSDDTPQTILIGAGSYYEQVNVTRQGPMTILGQLSSSNENLVTFTYEYGARQTTVNGVTFYSSIDNKYTAVLTVSNHEPNAPGCTDFKIYNVNLENTWGPLRKGPALAVSVVAGFASFYGVDAKGFQDTVYVGPLGNALFYKSMIRGRTDYLYGYGKLWVEASYLANRGHENATQIQSGIVAWKGSNGTNMYGCYISNSHLIRSPDIDPSQDITRRVPLGRPWNNLARTIYMSTRMDDHILPAGFIPWQPSDPRLEYVVYGEYNSTGPGFTPSQRAFLPEGSSLDTFPTGPAALEHDLTKDQADQFNFNKVFGGDSWADWGYAL